MTRTRLTATILVATALVVSAVGFTTRHSSSSTPTAALGSSAGTLALQKTFIDVYKKVSPSVVQIRTSDGLGSDGLGSGIVFDTKGHVVTNAHVVSGATNVTVTTSTGKRLKGTLVGEFPQDDLAVIKVDGSGLHPATFADSSKLVVGQIAIAIGNPLGLSSSVTEGIVSALNRQEPEGNGVTLQNAIQTSAAINPGNSGGALVDILGRVIGIPTLAAQDPQFGGAAAGIGFAIPSNTVLDIAGQIAKNGRVTSSNRAYLGVQIGDTGNGVYVGAVTSGGPAGKAGIAAGDVIKSVNGQQTATSDDLRTVLAGLKPGKAVKVSILRQDGTTATKNVTLGELPVN
jgi:S1-C subfamily serine protease